MLYRHAYLLCKAVEVLATLLANCSDIVGGFLTQRLSSATRIVGHSALLSKYVEEYLFDVYFTPNFTPLPAVGKIQTSEHPGLYLFPSVLCKEPARRRREFLFDCGKTLAP